MKSFLDLLNDGIIDSQTIGNITLTSAMMALMMALLAGVIIYFVYKISHSGVMFINNFAITLVGLTMVTSLVILTITSNILLSLGMVGALSIVRFRTVIKEPMDMIYMFWSIATGIAIGAGFFSLAAIGLITISLVMYGLSRFSYKNDLFILVVQDEKMTRHELETIIKGHAKALRFRAESKLSHGSEMTYELRMQTTDALMIELKSKLDHVSLVSYNTNTLL